MFRLAVVSLLLIAAVAAEDASPLPPDIQATVDRIRRENHPESARQAAAEAQPPKQATAPEPANDAADLAADLDDNRILLNAMESTSADDLLSSRTRLDAVEQSAREMLAAAQRLAERAAKRADRSGEASAREEAEHARQTLDMVTERAAMLAEAIEMARADEQRPGGARMVNLATLRYDGSGRLIRPAEMAQLSAEYFRKFSKTLPVSAWGESSTHVLYGFDHRGRVDVAVNPDGPEGLWIRGWLERQRIPYYAFRSAVLGRATGPHIHIGPGSTRVQAFRGHAAARVGAE
jgi:hypothetical protein